MTLDLRGHFTEFRAAQPGRTHLAAHSHHFWPDAACDAHRRALADAALRARDELAEDNFPFVVGEPRGVGERAAMGVACGVRPKMMAVRREMNAPRLRRAKLGEMPAQIERHHAPGLAAYL